MHTPANLLFWILFLAFVIAMIVFDLGILHRKAQAPTMGSALRWTALWVALAAGFAAGNIAAKFRGADRRHHATRRVTDV